MIEILQQIGAVRTVAIWWTIRDDGWNCFEVKGKDSDEFVIPDIM